jgi:Spy/CpxP family protein refolding chaperone
MSAEQQKRLISLMKIRADKRNQISYTARLAIFKLQNLALIESYDEIKARELARIYGGAVAALTLLDIEFASQVRRMLTPQQRQALQSSLRSGR